MLKSMSDHLKKVFRFTDFLAGVCFFSVMILVLSNIIMRNFFRRPIMGTVEIVSLLVATGLGLALANCEMLDGHIGMDLSLDKIFSQKTQKVIEAISYTISLSFWLIVVWRICVYANTSFINGRVTSTASIPIYPFIYILGFNILSLCVALASKLAIRIGDLSEMHGRSSQERKEESK